MRTILTRLHALVVGAVVVVGLMLGAGNGLHGLVSALSAADAHVCTCASGSSHAACPVCNHTLLVSRRSARPSVDGLPCGDRRLTSVAAGEVATLAPLFVAVVPAPHSIGAARDDRGLSLDRDIEPATPPPRSALPG